MIINREATDEYIVVTGIKVSCLIDCAMKLVKLY